MQNITVRLISIIPYLQTESNGDELFIKVKGKKIWPVTKKFQHMGKEKQPIEVTISLTEADTLDLELWEYDNFVSKERLGCFKILVDKKGGPFEASLVKKINLNCNYALQWEAI